MHFVLWGGVRVKKLRLRTNMLSANQAEAQFDFMKPNQWSLDISDDEVWADDDYLRTFGVASRSRN